MTALSPETRRLLDLSRHGDDPSDLSEQAVRNRLIARLGVTALVGVTTASAAAGAAEAASAASAAVLSGGVPASTVIGSAATQASAGFTATTLAKTVASLVLAAGLGAGAWKGDAISEQAVEWSATVSVNAKEAVNQVRNFLLGDSRDAPTKVRPGSAHTFDPSIGSDAYRHERLMEIARRPNRPVAKEAELVLILRAEQALTAGDPKLAAHYLDEHEAHFEMGVLSGDREALRAAIVRARGASETVPPVPPSSTEPAGPTEPNF